LKRFIHPASKAW